MLFHNLLLIQTVVKMDFSHVPLSLLSELCCTWPFTALYNKRQRSCSACPSEILRLPSFASHSLHLCSGSWTSCSTGLFFAAGVVLFLLVYPTRGNGFFKGKVEGAGARLTRKNVQSVQSPSLCKGNAAKSRFAQASCLSSIFGVSNCIIYKRLCIWE